MCFTGSLWIVGSHICRSRQGPMMTGPPYPVYRLVSYSRRRPTKIFCSSEKVIPFLRGALHLELESEKAKLSCSEDFYLLECPWCTSTVKEQRLKLYNITLRKYFLQSCTLSYLWIQSTVGSQDHPFQRSAKVIKAAVVSSWRGVLLSSMSRLISLLHCIDWRTVCFLGSCKPPFLWLRYNNHWR